MRWRRGSTVMLVSVLGVALVSSAASASPTRSDSHHSASVRAGASRKAAAAVRRLLNSNGRHIYPAPAQRKKITAALDQVQPNTVITNGEFSNRGGPVMAEGAQEVPIFWEPDTLQDGITPSFMETGYQAGMVQFLNDMNQSRWLHTLTLYYQEDSSGNRTYIKDFSGVLQMVIDHSPFPDTGDLCTAAGHPTNCLSDAQIQDEVSAVRAQNNLPGGLQTIYPVFLPRDEATCFTTAASYWCSHSPNLIFCAYHDAFQDSDGQPAIYSVEPYPAEGACHDPVDTFYNSMSLDLGRAILSHEVAEAITDPLPGLNRAWVDGAGEEVADLCNFDWGPDVFDRFPGVVVNQVWNGHPYLAQRLYDNSYPVPAGRCSHAGPFDAGGTRTAAISGTWTNIAVGSDPARGPLLSERANDFTLLTGHFTLDVTAQAPSPDGSTLYLLDHSSDQLLAVGASGVGVFPGPGLSGFPVSISAQATSIALTPNGQSVLITNGSDGTITTVNASDGTASTSPILGASLSDLAITADGASVWVADGNALRRFSLPGLTPIGAPLPLPAPASGLALSASGSDAYVSIPAQHATIDINLANGTTRWSSAPLPVSSTRPAVTTDGRVLSVDHDNDRVLVISANGSVATIPVSKPISVTATADGNALVLAGDGIKRFIVPLNLTALSQGTLLRAEADSAVSSPLASQPPVAAFTPMSATLGQASSFDASASHAQYGIASYRWTFGDGSSLTSTTPKVTHTYNKLGTYTVTLTVTDTLGVSTAGTVWDGHEYLRVSSPSASTSATTALVPTTTPRLLVATSNGLVPVYETGPGWPGAPLGARGKIADFAVSPNGRTAYLVTAAPATQLVGVNTTTGATSGAVITLPETPQAIALSPDGTKAYVALADGIIPVDLGGGLVGQRISVGDDTTLLTDLVVSPDGTTAWATDYTTNQVYPVNLVTQTVGAPLGTGSYLEGLTITPDGSQLLVPAFFSSEIDPIATTGQTLPPITMPDWFPQQDTVTPDGNTLLVSANSGNFADGSTSLFALNLATNNLGAPVSVPRSKQVCNTTPDGFLCVPARVTISSMPDGATAYAGVTGDDAVFGLNLSTMTLGPRLALAGQQGVARPVPAQSPTAQIKVSVGKPGKQSTFNGAGSSSPSGSIVSWRWDYGDGSTETTTTPSAHHTYSKAGTYTVTLTVTDSSGVSTAKVWDGHQLSRNGASTAQAALVITV